MPRPDAKDDSRFDAALVMLSNFGVADGGRETWAYSFIPRLLERHPRLRLSVFGLRVEGEPDSSTFLRDLEPNEDRLRIHFTKAPRSRTPNAAHFWRGLRDFPGEYRFVLAVGSFVELIGVLASPALRKSPKIAWLRTIFVEEKAHRLPRPFRPILRAIERNVLSKANLVIANGDDTASFYRKEGLSVVVNRNAIDFERWSARPVHIGTSPLKVAYVGRLAAVKGIREFVTLANSWEGQRPVQFHVVGSGPEEPAVRDAHDRGSLVFHGAIPNTELPRFLETIDACVALTFKSTSGGTAGLSNALLEQMASGRAIIAWRNEIFEQVLDDSNAFLVTQGSIEALARAIDQLLSEPESTHSKALRAQEVARAHSFDVHMDRFDRSLGELGLL